MTFVYCRFSKSLPAGFPFRGEGVKKITIMKQFIQYSIFIFFFSNAFLSEINAQDKYSKNPIWTFGAEKGYAQIAGEVTPQNGFGFGLFVEKNFRTLVGLRLQAGMGDMRGLDRTATEKWREHPVWNGTRFAQIDYKNADAAGVFANYRTVYRQASLSANFNLTKLRFFKNKSPYDFFLTGGIGGMQFQTSIDAADVGGVYDFSKIQILPDDTEAKTLTDLSGLLDGKFESKFEEEMTFTPLYQIGAGITRHFKKNLAFSIKHQLSFTNTDLLDSYDRDDQNQVSAGNDLWHFTTLSLSYTIFKLKKITPEEEEVVKKAFDNLEFDSGEAGIQPVSFPALNELAELMKQHPEWKLRIAGHTDSAGEEDYNMQLSKDRAEAVRNYLARQGIELRRFVVEWFGEKRPIASNETKEGKQLNRRVELEILE